MNLSSIMKVESQNVRNILYAQQKQIESLKQEIEDLKRPKTNLVGYPLGTNSTTMDLMFTKINYGGEKVL